MIKSSYGYDLIKSFKESNLETSTLEIEEKPKLVYNLSKSNDEENMFSPSATAFINTSEFTKVAKFFEKNGVYTKAHPIYDKYEYNSFWDREEDRRKNGMTVPGELYKDSEGYWKLRNIHITGEHYGYLNYARIKRIPEKDLEEAQELIGALNTQTLAASKEITFPDFWDGDYFYFKAIELARKVGKHLVIGKARRKGYSYKNGWIAANKADLYPNSITALAAYDAKSLYPEGTFKMADDYLQFIFEHTAWRKRRLRDSKEGFIKFGYRLKSSPSVERGFKSAIIAEPFGPAQPGALRGKDADLIIVEEAGKARNLADFMESTLPTLKAGKYITGLMIVFGTGGGEENYWEAFEDLFYAPDISDFLVFENLFDKDSEGEGAGFFVPDFANKEGFYDNFGNSNVVEAVDYEIEIRQKLKVKGKVKKLRDRSMEYCFSPSEAFSRGSDNIFNKDLINEQISRLKKDPVLKGLARAGNIVLENNIFKFKDARFMDEDELKSFHPPVDDLILKPSKDNHGCFVQFSPPYRDRNGLIPGNLYRIWHDPFGVDKEKEKMTNKHSFGCFYVYERVNNLTASKGGRLVGVYIGRPETTDAVNELMYRAAMAYNAKILFEKNVGTTYSWFRQKELLDMLVPEPKIISGADEASTSLKVKYGVHINDDRKRNGALYLKDFLEKIIDTDSYGNPIRHIHYIPDINLLRELLKWNLKGNFDRVSTMILGMYDIQEQFFVEIETYEPELNRDNIFNRPLF
jgi:hypothetical protein